MGKNEIVTGLDIGTTKICALIAEISDSGEATIIGSGISPSVGMMRGVVVDIDATAKAIEEAITAASKQANVEVDGVYVGVTGEHIASLNSQGIIPITRPDREITQEDVMRVNEQSRVIVLPPDRQIVHAIPRVYTVDGQSGITKPVGMSGTRLSVETHIVHGAVTFLQNIEKCVTKAGHEVIEEVLEPIASGEAVLLPTERASGVCLVDIGGGTCDIAVFYEGEIYYTAVVPIGGNHVTNDVAEGLKVGREEAERLKTQSGSAVLDLVVEEDVITLHQIGRDEERKLRRRALVQIIQPRMQEMFEMIRDELARADCLDKIPFGLVISGGGSQLRDCATIAQQTLGLPVRIGKPHGVGGMGESLTHPRFATAVGLIKFAVKQRSMESQIEKNRKPAKVFGLRALWAKFLEMLGV